MQKYQKWEKDLPTSDYNKFTGNTVDAKITQKKLINEYNLNEKIKTLTTKKKQQNISNKSRIKSRAR